MLDKGDICIVNEKAKDVLTGMYATLIGKEVMIRSTEVVNDKYLIMVLNPDKYNPFHFSSQLQMREDLLTKER